jgi:hypothetical protein
MSARSLDLELTAFAAVNAVFGLFLFMLLDRLSKN